MLALAMLSLIGVPLTGGFFAKFFIFSGAAQVGLWWLLIVGVVNTGMSAFYYLRVVFALYSVLHLKQEHRASGSGACSRACRSSDRWCRYLSNASAPYRRASLTIPGVLISRARRVHTSSFWFLHFGLPC